MSISGLSASLLASAKAFCRGSILIAISVYSDCSAFADFFKSPAKLGASGFPTLTLFQWEGPGRRGFTSPTSRNPLSLGGWGQLHYSYRGPHGVPNRSRSPSTLSFVL